MKHLLIDGMFGGTGVRDEIEGGYLNLFSLGISLTLQTDIENWLQRYAEEHFFQFEDENKVINLDKDGINLARRLREELENVKVEYFSDATMQKIEI